MSEPATAKLAKCYVAHIHQQKDGSFEIHDLEDRLRVDIFSESATTLYQENS